MTFPTPLRPLLATFLLLPILVVHQGIARAAADGASATDPATLFADANLFAWCIVPYDQRERSPTERIAVLRERPRRGRLESGGTASGVVGGIPRQRL